MDLVDYLLKDRCCKVGLDVYFHKANCITIVIQNELLVFEGVSENGPWNSRETCKFPVDLL